MNLDHDRALFYPKNKRDPQVELFIQLGKVTKVYERIYDKLQDVLAQTGGSIKILLIFFAILASPVVHFNFYKDIANEYFDYEFEEKNIIKKEPLKFGFFHYIY